MSRRKGRILAFQALYSWDVNHESIEDLLTFSWLEKENEGNEEVINKPLANVNEERTFASLIIKGTIDNITEIDKVITSHLASDWSIDRLNRVTLALLRIGTYEIKYQSNVPSKIIIDEAVNIAKDYGTDDSYKFINAVLDKIGKDENKQ